MHKKGAMICLKVQTNMPVANYSVVLKDIKSDRM